MSAVWLNGSFVERDDARVSAFDAGLQHGVGLFETMLACGGRTLWLHEHLSRLQVSARALGLSESLRLNPLAEAVRRVVERSGLERARVRLTVTGGDLNLLSSTGRGPTEPTVLIAAQPATAYPAAMREGGVRAVIAEPRLNPLNPFEGHKTLNYWMRLRELQVAAGKGAGEALFLQISNHVAGGAVSSLLVVKDGTLRTPIARGEEVEGGVRSPVLPGVTRGAAMEAAERMGLAVERRMLSVADVLEADEAMLTNSSWGVLPLVGVEGADIGAGVPGEATRGLQAWWEGVCAGEGGSP